MGAASAPWCPCDGGGELDSLGSSQGRRSCRALQRFCLGASGRPAVRRWSSTFRCALGALGLGEGLGVPSARPDPPKRPGPSPALGPGCQAATQQRRGAAFAPPKRSNSAPAVHCADTKWKVLRPISQTCPSNMYKRMAVAVPFGQVIDVYEDCRSPFCCCSITHTCFIDQWVCSGVSICLRAIAPAIGHRHWPPFPTGGCPASGSRAMRRHVW